VVVFSKSRRTGLTRSGGTCFFFFFHPRLGYLPPSRAQTPDSNIGDSVRRLRAANESRKFCWRKQPKASLPQMRFGFNGMFLHPLLLDWFSFFFCHVIESGLLSRSIQCGFGRIFEAPAYHRPRTAGSSASNPGTIGLATVPSAFATNAADNPSSGPPC